MSNIGDGFKNIFLAGIGALAYTGEKGKEVIDQLVEKGELTLDQGRELNQELKHKAEEAVTSFHDSTLEARVKSMSPEERNDFIDSVKRIVDEQNNREKKEQKDEVVTVEEAVVVTVEEDNQDK